MYSANLTGAISNEPGGIGFSCLFFPVPICVFVTLARVRPR